MALPIQELFLAAADLMFASALSCLFYAAGCLVVPGLVGYVVVLSCGAGVMKSAKRSICRAKGAALSAVSNSCVGRAAGKILAVAGFRGAAEGECASSLQAEQRPAGQKKCQKAGRTPTGSHLPGTGMSRGMKLQSGVIWEEERETSQADEPKEPVHPKKLSVILAFLLSPLFASVNWCLKKRHFQRLATLLTTLRKSRD